VQSSAIGNFGAAFMSVMQSVSHPGGLWKFVTDAERRHFPKQFQIDETPVAKRIDFPPQD
jgi:hypothetical protein